MRRHFTKLFFACASACVLATGMSAQSYLLEAQIPFTFHVGSTTLESGQYVVQNEQNHRFQTIRNSKTGESVMTMGRTDQESASAKPRLIFHRYGRQYFLSEVWAGNGNRSSFPLSRAEKEARMATPAAETATTTLLLVASR